MWFQTLNLVVASIHTISTIGVLVAGLADTSVRDFTSPVFHSYHSEDGFQVTREGSVHVLPFVVLPGIVSAIGHWVLGFTESDISRTGTNRVRWIDYSISSPLMMIGISLLCGVANTWVLVSISFMQSFLMLSSLYIENDGNSVFPVFAMALYYGVVVWGPAFQALDSNNPPAFVDAIVTTMFLLFGSFGVVYLLARIGFYPPPKTEIMYAVLSVVAKLMLQWLVYGGIAGMSDGNTTPVSIVIPSVLFLGGVVGVLFWRSV